MDNTWTDLAQTCEKLIREGRSSQASKLLSPIPTAKVPRAQRLPLAKLCRRTGLINMGLKILGRSVLTEIYPGNGPASGAEIAEYAVLLQRSGALSEAFKRLATVDVQQTPEALLYRAFVHFARWEYEAATGQLQCYLKNSQLNPHERATGNLNLAFALIECYRHDEANQILEELIAREALQIQSSALALRGQILVQENHFQEALQILEKSRDLSGPAQSNDQLFSLKWQMIVEGLVKKDLGRFEELNKIARQHRAWEILRESDLYSLKLSSSPERLGFVYFGSPYAGFRNRMDRELGAIPPAESFLLGNSSSPRLDILSGRLDGKETLRSGHQSHQLIEIFLRDFYRPMRVAGLFSELFPTEHFDSGSSPGRVHQVLTRFRKNMTEAELPLRPIEAGGFYSLMQTGPIAIQIPLRRTRVTSQAQRLELLKQTLGPQALFTAREAIEVLGISGPTVHRWIQSSLKNGEIEPARRGRANRFRFKNAA